MTKDKKRIKIQQSQLHITSSRMLKLIEYMEERGLAKGQGDALIQIGFNPANIRKIRAGDNKFTVDQIEAICKITGASSDFIFGFTSEMMRKPAKKPLDMLREAFAAVEMQLGK